MSKEVGSLQSSIAEIINTDLLNVKKDSVYEIADILSYHKEKIEKALRQKEETLFAAKSTLFLYDLTNTYFEGACKNNSIAKRAKLFVLIGNYEYKSKVGLKCLKNLKYKANMKV